MNDQSPLTESDLARMLINSYYAITVHPDLTTKHEPLVSRKMWMRANTNLIKEMGPELWLYQLLEVLEGNCPQD